MATLTAVPPAYRRRAQVPVYYPGDDFVSFEVGRCYHWSGNDTQMITDWLTHPRNPDNNDIMENAPPQAVPGFDAYACAELICRELGKKGFVILEGTASEQEAQKAEARIRWLRNKEREVAETIAGHERDCALRQSIGQPLPERTERVDNAYEWRRKNRGSLKYRPELTCDICAWHALSREALAEHRLDEHPQAPAPTPVATVPAAQLVAVPPKAAPAPEAQVAVEQEDAPVMPAGVEDAFKAVGKGFSKVQAKAAGRDLLLRAESLAVELSVADKKGLVAGDPDVMNDVAGRLTARTK